jgi:O-antigen ligase
MADSSLKGVLAFVRVRVLLRYIFMSVSLVGAFSLQRLSPGLEALGLLAEPRFVLAVTVSALAVLGWSGGAGRIRVDRQLACLLVLFVALHGLVACSYFWSFDPWFAPQQLADLSILMLSLMAFVALFCDEPLASVRVVTHVAVALALIVGVLWAASGFEQGAYGIGGIGAARLFGAAILAVLFVRYRTGRVSILLLSVPFAVGILVSGSRASLVALLPALIAIWLGRERIAGGVVRGTGRELIGALCLLAVLGGLALTPPGAELWDAMLLALLGPPAGAGGVDSVYLADRDAIFLHALQTFGDSALSGLGVGTYRGPFGEEYPHNLVLGYAVDAGIVAVLLFCGLLSGFLILSARARAPLEAFAVAIALFTLVASMFAGSYYDARMFWFMFAALAMQSSLRATHGVPGGSSLPKRESASPLDRAEAKGSVA